MTTDEQKQPMRVVARLTGLSGMLWLGGWLFTIGFAKLAWWKIVFGVILWPYFLALVLR